VNPIAAVLSSPRRRRRLFRLALVCLVIGTVALIAIAFPNTGRLKETFSNEPAVVIEDPDPVPLSKEAKAATLATAREFLSTAVRRERLAESWDLVAPSLRQGMSREEWAKGEIPVVPYPVDFAKYRFDYSYAEVVGLQAYVFPPAGDKSVRPMVFYMDLVPSGAGKNRRWLVSSFTPAGASPASGPASLADLFDGDGEPAKSRISPLFLVLPAVLVALALMTIVGIGVRDWRRGVRAQRAYSSSSKPS
jgi:hypothetical protein